MKSVKSVFLAAALTLSVSSVAMATPSGQIWIPSTDAKGFKEVNISIDNYGRISNSPDAGYNYYNAGVTLGISPLEKFKVEIGADYYTDNGQPADTLASKHAGYLNAKAAIPEDAAFKGMPALAVGVYGINPAAELLSTNIAYGLVAKTFPVIGRLSAGGYRGAVTALGESNTGVLASWDRSMSEISDKLWLAVDYMSGNNMMGAVSVGGSWTFTPNVSVLVGANFYQNVVLGGKPTFTTQLDINF